MKHMKSLDLKITRERLSEQVVQQLQSLITTGELQPGDRLPPERQLAEQLGVSRTVIRESIKTLEQRGLVKVLTGSGTYVSQMDPQVVMESIGLFVQQRTPSFDQLNEVRWMLDVEVAGLAAQRATTENLEKLKQAIEEMENNIDSPDKYIEADLAFHRALAGATRNEIFLLLIDVMVDLLRESRHMIFQVPGAPGRGQSWHRLIYEAVKKGDEAAAREVMGEHMQQVTKDAKQAELLQSEKLRSQV
jgi:GntR family transcriptional repressor for pyruvate dehydrogenase complex